MANPREKGNKTENRASDEQRNNNIMPMIYPGLNREKEMSEMVSALTHVLYGDVPPDYTVLPLASGGGSSSSTSSYGGSSALKRSREDDISFFEFSRGGSSSSHTIPNTTGKLVVN